ncbi:hypothetical protein A3J20_03430 [Candidatus Gottesmanbacteria bacterium RIFCSPLOWO2_02_FULL_42_29]|uniref:Uncharacterized protein n=1 Tax=Candidatus Gottesmanbacteria bacterium RIFCSPLOWO2_01_FULL_42_22 TaxID=1798391 RepID=A0A1F6BE26_9BACT|nr:MAG: hypothetical protein A2781_04915 [Candidatus Gottesmanbacteria bacterium RIFCSPHIGHO2_01_FULL_42_27]OGG21716.1 MAG: hypothetical protein A3E72_04580 [Candidatus Gottesmanbacteria bacterium RIFCSPHIGHO2_12_FULL_43_26]OGG35053.1 MAG: hypothetical protein A2968_00280 [Candidatus Gottesmanbacteria bacterium RIFCSPLOWO2_01_FULL_42_22]OGG35804.1 MAG: hypothetical protein A3G68_05610 [Candidatus Gottesmanbacteria bacterium RIFCSPLOWO2_12_FULL_42_10]OGG36445.1 MAG: hypothetical protein A3J20_03
MTSPISPKRIFFNLLTPFGQKITGFPIPSAKMKQLEPVCLKIGYFCPFIPGRWFKQDLEIDYRFI